MVIVGKFLFLIVGEGDFHVTEDLNSGSKGEHMSVTITESKSDYIDSDSLRSGWRHKDCLF